MREYINLMEDDQQKRKIISDLLSFPQNDLLHMYVDGFNDREVMEYWLQVDADALPETPEIAREWLLSNYTEESSNSLAEMILGSMSEQDIQEYGMNDEDEVNLEHEMSGIEENMDEFGYDEDAVGDRESMVQTQINDILAKTNTLMDKIGNEPPTDDQQVALDGYADRITQLENSLEN